MLLHDCFESRIVDPYTAAISEMKMDEPSAGGVRTFLKFTEILVVYLLRLILVFCSSFNRAVP